MSVTSTMYAYSEAVEDGAMEPTEDGLEWVWPDE